MPLFNVMGYKTKQYQTTVSANDSHNAYDIAQKRESIDWEIVDSDESVEITDVTEVDNEFGI
jgi:hypothetical protein